MGWAQRRPKRGKVVLGYPVGGSVTLPFHVSVLQLLGHELPKGDRRLLSKITHSQGLYVADNRTLLIQRMLETDADWLLQIDTDISFPATILETLLDLAGDDKLVLGASVPLGSEQFPTSAFMLTKTPGVWECVPQVRGVMEVDGLATAVLLTHRKVLEDIAAEHGQCWMHHIYLPARSDYRSASEFKYLSQGEDLAFCVRVKNAGHRIWCANVPGLRHYKTRGLSHDDDVGFESDGGVGELVGPAEEGVA